MTPLATMQSEAMWGYHPLAGERSGAHEPAGDDAERSDEEEWRP
jgi:hypothetical protein